MEQIYGSAWHHPGVAWLANVALLALGLRGTRGEMRLFLVAAAITAMLDAWLTGALSPVTDPGWAQAFGIAFVIAGDWRYFLVMERRAFPAQHWARALGVSLALAFAVPLLQTALIES